MSLLAETLRFAIPMWRIQMAGMSRKRLMEVAHDCAPILAEKGDALMFKCKGTREAFNAMARGVAAMEMLAPEGWDTETILTSLAKHDAEFFGG